MWTSAAPRPPAGRTTAPLFPTLARRMLTVMALVTRVMMTRIMMVFQTSQTTAKLCLTLTRRTLMEII